MKVQLLIFRESDTFEGQHTHIDDYDFDVKVRIARELNIYTDEIKSDGGEIHTITHSAVHIDDDTVHYYTIFYDHH